LFGHRLAATAIIGDSLFEAVAGKPTERPVSSIEFMPSNGDIGRTPAAVLA